ncbi:hypothetical protein GCM10010394_12840 [Streptomyces crystallinus]|uniref:Uncharacterized protein n=1 Tax=Streptomyces crystallinus TaxID=68191 RepID=A0ABN1F8Y5_9ACTN
MVAGEQADYRVHILQGRTPSADPVRKGEGHKPCLSLWCVRTTVASRTSLASLYRGYPPKGKGIV